MHENEKSIGDKLPFGHEEEKLKTNLTPNKPQVAGSPMVLSSPVDLSLSPDLSLSLSRHLSLFQSLTLSIPLILCFTLFLKPTLCEAERKKSEEEQEKKNKKERAGQGESKRKEEEKKEFEIFIQKTGGAGREKFCVRAVKKTKNIINGQKVIISGHFFIWPLIMFKKI